MAQQQPQLIADVGTLRGQGEELGRLVKAAALAFERTRDWDPRHTAMALLSIAYGFCRRAGMNHATILHVANEQFSSIDRGIAEMKTPI